MMVAYKRTPRIVGMLFITATLAYMTGSGLLGSVLNASDVYASLQPRQTQVIFGVLFEVINAALVVGIGVLLFPILQEHSESIALGYLGSRIIESAILMVGVISPLVLITLGWQYTQAAGADASYYRSLGAITIKGHYLSFDMAMIALSLGSLILCYLLYRSRLIPRSISILGLFGYAALLAWGWLEIFGYGTRVILLLPEPCLKSSSPYGLS